MAHEQAEVINLEEKLSQFSDTWSPKVVARLNDYHLKVARLEGEFVWHRHPETDELFLVLAGTLEIRLRDGSRRLQAGELFVVPRGVEHQPVAHGQCRVLLIEPAGTLNTGDAGGDRTVADPEWI